MAWFKKNKPEEKKVRPEAEAPRGDALGTSKGVASTAATLAHVLRHARITEKATMHSADSVYTFDIAARASKRDVIAAVRALYKVTPRMVRVVTIRAKMRRNARTGKRGVTSGGKKAYVYLKKGETIT